MTTRGPDPADPWRKLLKRREAVLSGHFLLSSGRHSDAYVQCARVLEDPRDAARLGKALARLVPAGTGLVVSPALGGMLIGYEVARALKVRFLFAERADGKMSLRRGFSIPAGAKTVVVEDVLTTGGSSLEVLNVIHAAGGEPAAVLSIIDRGCDVARLGAPVKSLVTLPLGSWEPAACPLCAKGIPAVKPGSRSLAAAPA